MTILGVEMLLEREAELEALDSLVESAERGRRGVLLIRGEAGIGKTSLLRAARERGGIPFYMCHGEPLSVPEPLGPICELAAAVGAADPPELTSGDRRGLARALQAALTANGPAVGVIEDAHWAYPATLDVWRLLARSALSLAAVSSLAASAGADAVADARVTRLGREARAIVDLAAVIGQRVPLDLLIELGPADDQAFEEGLNRGVLTDDGATLGIRHELTRQAIEQSLSSHRRAATQRSPPRPPSASELCTRRACSSNGRFA